MTDCLVSKRQGPTNRTSDDEAIILGQNVGGMPLKMASSNSHNSRLDRSETLPSKPKISRRLSDSKASFQGGHAHRLLVCTSNDLEKCREQ